MRNKLVVPFATIALSGAMVFGAAAPMASAAPPAAASAVQLSDAVVAPITQVIAGVGTFQGTFTPTSFGTDSSGQLTVTGLLEGTLTRLDGTTQDVSGAISTTVASATANQSCDILSLVLGPLDLNLLGLDVELNQVELDIAAEPGPGNLLGNLLCSVAGLLDGNSTGGLANLLNRLLAL